MIEPVVKCAAGLDVHKKTVVCTVLQEGAEGRLSKSTREYPSFRARLQQLSQWLVEMGVELAVMESSGIYWQSVYESLEAAGINTYLVNSRHVKNVPGRKTDVKDSEWLAELARCGLLRASFIPSRDLRELRFLTRYRRKLVGYLVGEKNRLHKLLDSCGIRLGCVVSDLDGVSARRIINALLEGNQSPEDMAELVVGRLEKKKAEIRLALDGFLSDRHRFLLRRINNHIKWLQQQLAEIDAQVVAALEPYQREWQLLQTIPGIDQMGAAMLLAEIGTDMERFGSKEHLCSWAGMCPGNNESAGKKRPAGPHRATGMSASYSVRRPTAATKPTVSLKDFSKGS
ncbi:MAG: IS110 family transposase [Desulfobacca sp.]|nr:IS110 family transposase [Desulfobacca sp.]